MIKLTRITDLRYDNDLTQRELSNILNVKRSAYSKWECGINEFPLIIIIKLSLFFDVSVDYLANLSNIRGKANKNISIDNINKKITAFRKERNITQKEISTYLKITQKTYSDYELGKYKVPTSMAINIAKFHNISLEGLLSKQC